MVIEQYPMLHGVQCWLCLLLGAAGPDMSELLSRWQAEARAVAGALRGGGEAALYKAVGRRTVRHRAMYATPYAVFAAHRFYCMP